jgi:CBS-domain-containing membrane protein
MLDGLLLLKVVGVCIVFIPGWIILVARTSWDLSPKRWLMGTLVMISALSTGLIFAIPNSHLPTKIGGNLISIFISIVSIIVAYLFWPRQTS